MKLDYTKATGLKGYGGRRKFASEICNMFLQVPEEHQN